MVFLLYLKRLSAFTDLKGATAEVAQSWWDEMTVVVVFVGGGKKSKEGKPRPAPPPKFSFSFSLFWNYCRSSSLPRRERIERAPKLFLIIYRLQSLYYCVIVRVVVRNTGKGNDGNTKMRRMKSDHDDGENGRRKRWKTGAGGGEKPSGGDETEGHASAAEVETANRSPRFVPPKL